MLKQKILVPVILIPIAYILLNSGSQALAQAREPVSEAISWLFWIIAILFTLTISLGLLAGVLHLHKRLRFQSLDVREREAEIVKKEIEARFRIDTVGSQIYFTSFENLHFVTRSAHLDHRVYANGKPEPDNLNPVEILKWQAHLEAQSRQALPKSPQPPGLEAGGHGEVLWPEQIRLSSLLASEGGASLNRLILGVSMLPSGQREIISAPIERLVHIAVGGSSGFGKSAFTQALAYQVATAPELAELCFVDIEGVTFKALASGLGSKLRYPVAESGAEALAILDDLMGEMERRKELFRPYPTVEKLSEYNSLAGKPLSTITCFFDEVTALLGSDKAVEAALKDLALRARKYGIYLLLSGQDWKASSLDSAIKNQLSTVVQFRARSKAQSNVLLGSSEAASLNKPGRGIADIPGRGRIEILAPMVNKGSLLEAQYDGEPNRPLNVEQAQSQDDKEPEQERLLEQFGTMKESGESLSAICRELFGVNLAGAYYTKTKELETLWEAKTERV